MISLSFPVFIPNCMDTKRVLVTIEPKVNKYQLKESIYFSNKKLNNLSMEI